MVKYKDALAKTLMYNSIQHKGTFIYDGDKSIKTFTVPEGTATIGKCAFRDCSNLETIVLPSSIKEIQSQAFYGCSSLKEIKIPDEVIKLPYQCFEKCEKLTTVTLSKNLQIIDDACFENCISLKFIDFPSGLREIREYAFRSCTSLESISIPDSVYEIGNLAFASCTSLNSVRLPYNLRELNQAVFSKCENLEYIKIPPFVESIYSGAFRSCTNLKSFFASSSLSYLAPDVFFNCVNLKEVVIPGIPFTKDEIDGSEYLRFHLDNLNHSVFTKCKSLETINNVDVSNVNYIITEKELNSYLEKGSKDIVLPPFPGVEKIYYYAFTECDLNSVTLNPNIKYIGAYAFYKSTLKSIDIKDSVTYLGEECFSFCKNLEYVKHGEQDIICDGDCFLDCDNLKSLTYIDKLKVFSHTLLAVEEGTKYLNLNQYPLIHHLCTDCFTDSLTTIIVGDNIKEIVGGSFIFGDNIVAVTLPETLEVIERGAFSYLDNLSIINIPHGAKIDPDAFYECPHIQYNSWGGFSVKDEIEEEKEDEVCEGIPASSILSWSEHR